MIGLNYITQSKRRLISVEQLGKSGGEGSVYLCDNGFAIKVFNEKADLELKSRKIDSLISKKIFDKTFALPIEKIFLENGKFQGFLMNTAQGETMQSCVFSRNGLLKKFPSWERINLANLAITLLKKLQILHNNKIIVGDINPYNIMVKSDTELFFIDTDSFQVDDFLCTVGTDLFTAPELQGADFKKTIRSIYNEQFSIATLLFMIFLPGKNPFAYTGGGDLAKNIKDQNFSYPLGEDDNLQAPKGIWEVIWNDLNYDLRKAFYDVFKDVKRFTISQWIIVIESYKEDLQKGYCSKQIFPSQLTYKFEKYKTLNLNGRNIHENNARLRKDETELSLNRKNEKIGVLELSTTAVKLLTGDQSKIKHDNFDFNHYVRMSDRTMTGSFLDSDNVMNIQEFETCVLPAIKNRVDYAINSNVTKLYTVATAAYRTAFNRNQIVDLIKAKCGINVKILTKKEEALATLSAFIFSKPADVNFEPNKNYMFIDQGGGSTEITVFRGQYIVETYSVNLGSTVLNNIFFKEATETTTFDKAFKDSEKLIKDRLRVYLRNYNPQNLGKFCISVGNAIVQATGGKKASDKHGVRLSIEDIKMKIQEFDNILRAKYESISHLFDACEENRAQQARMERKSDQVDNILNSRLALPMYIEIMERFKLEDVIISNTGLFYGIFLEKHFKQQ